MIQLTGDYHTHTPYSHGKNSVLENVIAAKNIGLSEIAITDHGFNHILFGLRRQKLPDLRKEIEEAKLATGLNVLMGMESNLISLDGESDMRVEDYQYFDIFLCGIHEVLRFKSGKDCRKILCRNFISYKFGKTPSKSLIDDTTNAFIQLVKNYPVDILTHLNFKSFCNLVEIAKVCADYGTYIEINTKKRHISPEELNEMAKTGVHFVIDSDAHSADRVGDTQIAEELLKEAQIDLSLIDNINGKTPNFRFQRYKEEHL